MSKNNTNSLINFAPSDNRLYLRIFLTIAGCLVIVVGLGFTLEKFRWQAQAREIRRNADADTAVYPHLDPTVRQQLDKALAPENLNLTAAQNPFIDRANLSSQKPVALQTIQTKIAVPPPIVENGLQATISPNQLPVNGSSQTATGQNYAISELNNRLRERDRMARNGKEALQPISTVYDVEDVEPIGVIGKTSASEVLFRSKTTRKVFSAPLGAKFNNGTLRDAEATGVIFVNDQSRAAEKKFWVKTKAVKDNEAEPVLPVNPKN